jgi:phospholipid transport system transporter-binding protein
MPTTMLKLPASVRMDEVPALWASLQASLRAEAAQLRSAAGAQLRISAAELQQFDSSVLSLLISAARLCAEQGLQLSLQEVPAKLQELARVYGVAELLWPELVGQPA